MRRPVRILAVGHSTRPLDELIGMLQAAGVATLADIRTVPRSRKNPQFNRETLPAALARQGIGYAHLPKLGGLRHAHGKNPASAAWRNPSFRGFADYMQTEAFDDGLEELLGLPGPVALMCAEALPWRCHRSLVADALLARGVPVWHLLGKGEPTPHRPMPFARIGRGRVTYPADEASP